jgi:CheY-like chemotaxis protein
LKEQNDRVGFIVADGKIELAGNPSQVYNKRYNSIWRDLMTKPTRILVVDDEPDTLGLIELTLQTAGHEVRLASGGVEGLQLARQLEFDVILLDIMMPDLSGFDVLRALREDPGNHPPVIVLTAKNRPEDRDIGMSLGATDYLGKPITRGSLLDAIQKAIGEETNADAPS